MVEQQIPPKKATIRDLAGMLQSVDFETIPVKPEDTEIDSSGKRVARVKYNEYGQPINIRETQSAVQYSARLMLEKIYSDWEISPEKRAEAGEALGYTKTRIAVHEATGELLRPLSELTRSIHSGYERLIFGQGRNLIDHGPSSDRLPPGKRAA